MTTRADLEAELLERLLVADNSTLYPSTRITSLIKNAYIWATQLVIWHDLVRAVYTTTFVNTEYYDYPCEFRSESIVRMEINSEKYVRKNFEDYLDFKRRNPSSTKKIFASFGRKYFIHPTPTIAGYEITLWGAIQADALSASTSVPIFSYNKEEANEAVIQKAFAVAIKRLDPNLAKSEEQEATVTLLRLSKYEQDNTQRNQRLNHPMFAVPDYLGGNLNGSTPIGGFNYLIDEGDDD
jgi:glycogen debranching enzyme